MKIATDHGLPKGTMPTDDAFDRFKNERDYIAQAKRLHTTVAAMDWAIAEIEQLRTAIEDTRSYVADTRELREILAWLTNDTAPADVVDGAKRRGRDILSGARLATPCRNDPGGTG
jgi:hypothetical protein